MRLVSMVEGRLELRWTWLPYWIAAGPAFPRDLEVLLRDVVVMNGMPVETEDSMIRIHHFVIAQIQRRFPIEGLNSYLTSITFVEET